MEEAKTLLDGLMRQSRLHITEFRALARAQLDYLLALGQTEGAFSWLGMWREVDEDNPELLDWAARIKGPERLARTWQNLAGHSPKK